MRFPLAFFSAFVLIWLFAASPVAAANYVGRGDTGDALYRNKRECCDAAVYAAQTDSMNLCRRAGGFAEPPRGVASGRCKWDRVQSNRGGAFLYSCAATATVRCR